MVVIISTQQQRLTDCLEQLVLIDLKMGRGFAGYLKGQSEMPNVNLTYHANCTSRILSTRHSYSLNAKLLNVKTGTVLCLQSQTILIFSGPVLTRLTEKHCVSYFSTEAEKIYVKQTTISLQMRIKFNYQQTFLMKT